MTAPAFLSVAWRADLPRAVVLRESLARVYPGARSVIAVLDRPGSPRPAIEDVLTIDDIPVPEPEWWMFGEGREGLREVIDAFAREVRRNNADVVYLAPTLMAYVPAADLARVPPAESVPGLPSLARFATRSESPTTLDSGSPDTSNLVGEFADVTLDSPAFVDFSSYHPSAAKWVNRAGLGLAALRCLAVYESTLYRFATVGAPNTLDRLSAFDNGVPIPPLARRLAAALTPSERRQFGSPYGVGAGSFYQYVSEGDENLPVARRLWLAAWASRPDVQEAFPDPGGADHERFLEWCGRSGRAEHSVPAPLSPKPARARVARPEGLNIIGYLDSDTGQGTAARGLAHAVTQAGGKVARVPLTHPEAPAPGFTSVELEDTAPYSTNVFVVGAPSTGELMGRLPQHTTPDHRAVGYWMWETDLLPESWTGWADVYDEVWAVSTYVADAIRRSTGIDALVVPHALEERNRPGARLERRQIGIPSEATVFLFMFDYLSSMERKNPLGLVEAFKRAFGDDLRAYLIVKSSRAAYDEVGQARLEDAVRGMANVRLLDAVFTTPRPLYDMADCYVSLHRSEGFGLTMAEAMAAGKPVIATGYSGNLDFMPPGSSHLVPYQLREIPGGCGPYPPGHAWAEPDLDAAADAMRRVFEHPEAAREMGERGRSAVRALLDPVKIGSLVRERIGILSRTPREVTGTAGRARP